MLIADPSLEYHIALDYLQQWFNEDKQDDVKELKFIEFLICNFSIIESKMDKR